MVRVVHLLILKEKGYPKKYKLRHYPDLTHTVRCSYPVKQWDQAFALTLGRECTNPQPLYYASVHNQYAANTMDFFPIRMEFMMMSTKLPGARWDGTQKMM
jgi:hypothetical protein